MTIPYEWIGSLILAVISSSWFGTWFSNRSSKKDILQAIADLNAKVDANEAKRDRKDAEQMRSKILRFDDELRIGVKHSQEYFDDIIKDITNYEDYCKKHDDFLNRKAERAIKHIITAYDSCHAKNNFL